MKWSVRGACAALSSCLLLACALSAAAVGLKCFSLGSELKGEPFRLGTAAGAFYSGLLLTAGLSLLGSALFCCRPPDEEGAGGAHRQGHAASEGAVVPVAGDAQPPSQPLPKAPPGGRQNFLLLGVLVFMLGVLSAFAGAVIDGDTVSLVEKKYSHYCLLQVGGGGGGSSARARPAGGPDGAGTTLLLRCQKLRDYQRGLVISTIFNALECLLGLLNLLLVKNYKAAQQRGLRRRRRCRQEQRLAGGRRRRRRGAGGGGGGGGGPGGSGGGRRPQRQSQGSIFSSEDPDLSPGGDCAFQAVSYINVGVFHVFDEAGVEVHCGGHPSIELPGYSPMDPELNASYPYCYPLPNEQPPAYEDIYPRELCANRV